MKKIRSKRTFLAIPTCGENEYYSACGDDGCQATCQIYNIRNRNRLQIKGNKDECTPSCSTGACICKPEFVRDATGACIPPEECRKGFLYFLSNSSS